MAAKKKTAKGKSKDKGKLSTKALRSAVGGEALYFSEKSGILAGGEKQLPVVNEKTGKLMADERVGACIYEKDKRR